MGYPVKEYGRQVVCPDCIDKAGGVKVKVKLSRQEAGALVALLECDICEKLMPFDRKDQPLPGPEDIPADRPVPEQ